MNTTYTPDDVIDLTNKIKIDDNFQGYMGLAPYFGESDRGTDDDDN